MHPPRRCPPHLPPLPPALPSAPGHSSDEALVAPAVSVPPDPPLPPLQALAGSPSFPASSSGSIQQVKGRVRLRVGRTAEQQSVRGRGGGGGGGGGGTTITAHPKGASKRASTAWQRVGTALEGGGDSWTAVITNRFRLWSNDPTSQSSHPPFEPCRPHRGGGGQRQPVLRSPPLQDRLHGEPPQARRAVIVLRPPRAPASTARCEAAHQLKPHDCGTGRRRPGTASLPAHSSHHVHVDYSASVTLFDRFPAPTPPTRHPTTTPPPLHLPTLNPASILPAPPPACPFRS